MDQIEEQVLLPQGAGKLSDYARYYAYADNGDVEAVYLITSNDKIGPNESCEELAVDLAGNEMNLTGKDVPCPNFSSPFRGLEAGERRWVSDRRSLPVVNDGGCGVLNLLFDRKAGKVKAVFCNGNA